MINVGIIGCGMITRKRHAPEYSNNPNVKIGGFCDHSKDRAQELVDRFGGKVFDTIDDMLNDKSIDAVSVCTANTYHAPITIDALNSKKHVLCEKPMAVTMDDCEKMIEAAQKNNKKLMIGQNQRLTLVHQRARQILQSGELGRIISFASTFGHKGPEMWGIDKSSNTWFFKKETAAFGSMADLGIHKIDLMRYLFGSDIGSVFANLRTLDKKFSDGTLIEVDDNSIEVLNFENGIMGTVTTSWTHYAEESNGTVIYCEKGMMKLYVDPEYQLQVLYNDGSKANFQLEKMQTNDDEEQVNSGVIDTFVEGIISDQKTVLDAEDVIKSMKAVFACLESQESGKTITL